MQSFDPFGKVIHFSFIIFHFYQFQNLALITVAMCTSVWFRLVLHDFYQPKWLVKGKFHQPKVNLYLALASWLPLVSRPEKFKVFSQTFGWLGRCRLLFVLYLSYLYWYIFRLPCTFGNQAMLGSYVVQGKQKQKKELQHFQV